MENNIVKHFNIYFADKDAADKFSEELSEFVKNSSDEEFSKSSVEEKIDQMFKDPKYSFGTSDTYESMIRIDISDTDYRTYVSYHCEINEDEDKAEEDPDTNKLIKGALIAGGLVILGIIIGKKTGRYKRWKGNYSIEKPFGMDDDDVSAINWFVNKQNEAWVKNHLVLAIDKRYKKPSGYRRK